MHQKRLLLAWEHSCCQVQYFNIPGQLLLLAPKHGLVKHNKNMQTKANMVSTLAAGRPEVVMSTAACSTVWNVFWVMSNVSTRLTDCLAATDPAPLCHTCCECNTHSTCVECCLTRRSGRLCHRASFELTGTSGAQ